MPMERWVKCLSPRNTFGVSGVNGIAAKSNPIEVTGDHIFNLKKTTEKNIECLHTAQGSGSPNFQIRLKTHTAHKLLPKGAHGVRGSIACSGSIASSGSIVA